jgi:DNA-binding response OmpR family regulator
MCAVYKGHGVTGEASDARAIIVVHDETQTRELAVSALCEAGLPAVCFDDLVKALAAIEADTRLRVLVTRLDFGRGKLNGAALARMLRHKQKDVRTMFVALPRYRVHASYRYP